MVEFINNMWDSFVSTLEKNGWKILMCLCILIIAFFLIKLLAFVFRKILYRTKIDDGVVLFYSTILTLVCWAGIIVLLAGILEIPTEQLIVALSSLALAVGLALKDSLSNLANGILIIFNKPFKRGDLVSIDGTEGTILNIRLLTTELVCADNRTIVLPNSKVVNGVVINYSALPTRRIDLVFSVSYNSDLDLVQEVLEKAINNHKLILKNPKAAVYLSKQNASSLDYTIKVWVNTEDYWPVYNELPGLMFKEFKKANIEVPYNQMDVHIIGE